MRLFSRGRVRCSVPSMVSRSTLGEIAFKRISLGCAVFLAALLMLSGWSSGTSTDPVRNTDPRDTVNPPDIANPIYYPFPVEARLGAPEVAPEALLREFMDRHTAMDYPAAAEAAFRLVDAAPDRPEAHYNLACVMSKLHRAGESLAALDKAIECGWRDLLHTTMDPDLVNVRSCEGYAALISKLKSKVEQERIVAVPLRQDEWQAVVTDLDHQVPELLARYHVPGATIALVKDGEVVWTSAFGVGDRRSNDPLREQDRFRVRGPLHLLALMAGQQQQDQGHVQLAQLLQQGAEIEQLAARAAERSGGYSSGRADGAQSGRTSTVGLDQTTGDIGSRGKPVARPDKDGPSTTYGLLQLAIEIASGESFSTYCTGHILNPLRLLETGFSAPCDASQRVATGHSRLGSPMQPNPKSDELAVGGSLYTTADDLGRLIQGLMIKSDGSAASANSISPANISQSAATALETTAQLAGGFGLALDVKHTNAGPRMQVQETTSGTGCLMRWYPSNRTGIVVLYNSATGRDAAQRIAHLALGGEE